MQTEQQTTSPQAAFVDPLAELLSKPHELGLDETESLRDKIQALQDTVDMVNDAVCHEIRIIKQRVCAVCGMPENHEMGFETILTLESRRKGFPWKVRSWKVV